MNKTILSVAVLAASGGYVAFANHAFDGVSGISPAASSKVVASVQATDAPKGALMPPAAVAAMPPAATALTLTLPAAAPPPAITKPAPRVAMNAEQGVVVQPAPRPPPLKKAAAAPVVVARTGPRDGTYVGSIEDAYYGAVQVQATVKGGELTAVDVLDYPQDRRTSRRINSIALPMLEEEAIAAQSARVDTITGATLTSRAYRASLDTALRQADQGHA